MFKAKLYTSDDCKVCKELKTYLDKNKVEYEELNIAQDKEAKKQLIAKRVVQVPHLEIAGKSFTGFNAKIIDELEKIFGEGA